MNQVGDLNNLHKKYYDRGFRVVAVTAENTGIVNSKLIEGKGAKYWVASDPGRATLRRFSVGSVGIPHMYLIDATGKVVGEGKPGAAQIEKLLEQVFLPELGRDLHAKLKGAVKMYDKGQIGKAWAAVAKLAAGEDRTLAEDAKFLRTKAEAYGAHMKKLVESGIADKDFDMVYDDIKAIGKDFAGMDVATWVAAKKKELDADADVKNEMSAMKSLKKAAGHEEKAGDKAKKMGPAIKGYKKVVKKYAGTRAAKMAEDALGRLGG